MTAYTPRKVITIQGCQLWTPCLMGKWFCVGQTHQSLTHFVQLKQTSSYKFQETRATAADDNNQVVHRNMYRGEGVSTELISLKSISYLESLESLTAHVGLTRRRSFPDRWLRGRKTLGTRVIFNIYSSSPNGVSVNSPGGRRPNGLLTRRP